MIAYLLFVPWCAFVGASFYCGCDSGIINGAKWVSELSRLKERGGGHLACLFFGSAFQSFRCREDTATGKAPRELENRQEESEIVG